MATAPAVSIQWIPEDDLLLKNAVEAGASLEALAKGAVLFSRRYSLRELQERWHSLLYDPDISAQAAAQIFELEISGINHASKFNRAENHTIGGKEVAQKRKHASIRRKYYAMRKKFRNELFSNSNLGIFEPNPHEFSEQSTDFQKQVMHDAIPDHLLLQEEDIDILRHAFQGPIRDISVASRANNAPGGYGFDGDATSSLIEGGNDILEVDIKNRKSSIDENPHNSSVGFKGTQQFNPANSDGFSSLQTSMFEPNQPHLRHWRRMQDVSASSVPTSMNLQDADRIAEDTIRHESEDKENSSTVCTGEYGDPDSLLNLSNEDEILLEDVENCAANKCCTDSTGAVIQDCIKDGQENDKAKPEPESVTVGEVVPLIAPSATPVVSEVSMSSVHGDQPMNSQPEVDAPSKSTLISDFTGLGGGKICCTLNTEDTEIPCNDDIFLLIHPSTSFGSSTTQPNSMGSMTSAHQKDYEQGLKFSMKGNESAKSSVWPHMVGTQAVHPLVGHTAKTKLHDSREQALLPGFATKTIGHSTKGGSQYAIPKQCSNSLVKKEVAGVDIKAGQNSATVTNIIQSTEAGPSRSQHPESAFDDSESDEVESGIDDDVPYFSDIEAMILEMDLDPYDQDSGIVRQVPSYQYDETKRTIIRLEQGARSCLRRAMTSHEALAILYGRHLRHYITKPEVLLGRSTDDMDVDIDLRKEGRANKISRRQAIIKMEADGSFFLRNLGKSSVLVNGVAVACGQLLNLSTSCLIEIRGMSFVFEINQDYVMKNLSRYFLKNKGKTGKSDWSAEDES
ncbi:uncharacterized protein LOC125214583 isoform X1 [Salvia hispanica]|uniref:uncharacterized protein LOC125214583 isoform X1 n=1 Tax=Salvia hispanica TaxID=49212 RepID=UPI00200900A1|nr:uncharacterized protein LOC125214583 isoform X1 [Salvia hispanica]XP_047971627.1 uncharacterized protein LOC125214583 isoform X1 [Salvia hispanica]XP_047971628.1 uncharacterized protein LOC125214583 isoform X1 [Salvia hispanica]